jgi:hypothetical protein
VKESSETNLKAGESSAIKLRMYEVIHVNIYGVPKVYVLKSGKVCAGKKLKMIQASFLNF